MLVTWSPKVESVSIMKLIVSASAAISPFASTVSLRLRLPCATAVTTSAMPRTWLVRLVAIRLTLSVRSFQVPPTPGTAAWPPSLPSVPTSRATRVTSDANAFSWSTMVLIVFLSARISPFTSTVIFFERSPLATAVVTSAMLRTWPVRFVGHQVHVVGQVLPRAGDAADLRLAAELALGADLARHAGHFGRERIELIDHRVDGVLELEDLALHVDGDLLGKVAQRHRGRHLRDVADLAGEVRGHGVHVVGQILPGPADARHLRLAAELSFGADLARDAGHFGGEGIQLIDHRVDGVLQLQDLAFHVDRDLLGKIALGDGGRHLGDVAHLAGEVAGHEVHAVGQVGPGAGDAFDLRLTAELSFRSRPRGRRGSLQTRTSSTDRPSC